MSVNRPRPTLAIGPANRVQAYQRAFNDIAARAHRAA